MDDAPDRGESRAPRLQDVLDLCAALNREGARYALIGGFAVILHGFVRTTKDVDLLVDPSVENIRAVKRAMATLPDNAAALLEDDEVQQYQVVRVADEIVVDLMASACGITYAETAESGIESFKVHEVEIPVASKETLIGMKNTIRESDAFDVARRADAKAWSSSGSGTDRGRETEASSVVGKKVRVGTGRPTGMSTTVTDIGIDGTSTGTVCLMTHPGNCRPTLPRSHGGKT